MRLKLFALIALVPLTALAAQDAAAPPAVEKPAALTADGIPPVPAELAARTRPYMEFRTAGFSGWNPRDRSMLITTRFGNTAQLHRVAMPMGAREQIELRGRAGRRQLVARRRRAGRQQGRRRQRILPDPHAGERPAEPAHRRAQPQPAQRLEP